jgi:hypothetical protein
VLESVAGAQNRAGDLERPELQEVVEEERRVLLIIQEKA